jgi:hypothetical protein
MRGCSFSLESSELLVETVVAPRRARTLYDSDHSTGKPKEHRVCTHTRLHDEEAAHWAVPACAPGPSNASRSPAARSRRRVRRLRARARPSVPAAACVAIASVGRSGDGEISGNGTTNMCCWCCDRRDARTALSPLCQHARPLCERNEIPQLSTCATERATQRSPLGTQQGALPYVGPEPRPTAASSRRNEQGRATTGVASANKVEASWAHHTRSTDAAIRAGAVVHEASKIPPPIV